ncbi:MAG: Trk system potassium transporter TrkA [Fibrobacterales bacterium]
MRIIIVGAGTVGKQLAGRLCEEGHDIIVIDHNHNKLRLLEEYYDLQTITGNGTSVDVLETANIAKSDLVISVTNSDASNVLIGKLASQMQPKTKNRVARIRSSQCFLDPTILTPNDMGINLVIFPEDEAAREIHNLILRPFADQCFQFLDNRVEIASLTIQDNHKLVNVTPDLLPNLCKHPFKIVCIVRDETPIIPVNWHGSFLPADKIYIAAENQHLTSVVQDLGFPVKPIKKIFIYGGDNVGMQVARELETTDIQVNIIESSRQRTKEMAFLLNKALVLHGEGTDSNLLEGEGVSEAEAFIAATQDENANLLSCLLAKRLGAKKTISLVAKPDFVPLISNLNVDSVISQRLITINKIMQFVRRGAIKAVEELIEDKVQALQFNVTEQTLVTNEKLSSSIFKNEFPSNAIIVGLIRKENTENENNVDDGIITKRAFIPDGNTELKYGDTVLLVCANKTLPKLEEFFA